MRKHIFKAIISIILTLSTIILSCTGAFAASGKERYISDLILCPADSADDAEAQLKEKGYKLLTDDAVADGVYMGYKSTADKDEAITDIAAMNMSGNYSFSDYETLIKQMRENVSDTVDGLVPMITSFRTNYKAGAAIATEVYEILNKFYEDDSEQGMGDFLLNCDLKDTTALTEVFLQGYSAFIVDIQQLLFLAGESDSGKTWVEKMAASDPDELVDLYVDSYPTPNKAYSALAADYGDAADDIQLTWDAFYENLSAIKAEYFKDDEGAVPDEEVINDQLDEAEENADEEIAENAADEVINESIGEISDSAEICDNVIDINLITYLDSLEYGDGTMLDFFLRPAEEVDDTELYTLAYFMGEKLTAQISNVGLEQVMSRILVDSSSASADRFENICEMLSGYDTISIYDGVDRSLFENGVALTGASVKEYESSGKNWSDDLFDRVFQPAGEYKWKDYLAFYVLPTVASLLTYSALFGVNYAMQTAINKAAGIGVKAVEKCSSKVVIELIHNDTSGASVTSVGFWAYGKGLAARGSAAYRFVAGIRCAFFVLTIAMTLVSIVMLFVTLTADDDAAVEYSSIPNHIVDTVATDHGDDYIAYNCVPDISGSAGDLYNYKGKAGWLSLYYTKDQSVGEPLTTNFRVVKGSANAPLDYENISLFGETNAVNVTSKDLTGVKDSANGTYMYISRSSSSAAGSAFSGGNMAIAVACGGVAGILLGMFFGRPKKKEETIPA